jgi:IS30 family transposase
VAEVEAARKRGLTAQERTQLWVRWKEGQSLSDIGRALGKAPASIFGFLNASGGIAPQGRRQSITALSMLDREEISRGVCTGDSFRGIAGGLRRSPSTISREIARNGGRDQYRAAAADSRAWGNAVRPKVCKLGTSPELQRLVAEKLQIDWSPEQIAGWLKQTFADDGAM